MPCGMCPLCGQMMIISVSADWYTQGMPRISPVPAKCFDCWQELKLGDSVKIRKGFAEEQNSHIGEVGVIKKISTAEDGQLFLIRLFCEKEIHLIRPQLRKLRENEIHPQNAAD
jgi:hypothetical protein